MDGAHKWKDEEFREAANEFSFSAKVYGGHKDRYTAILHGIVDDGTMQGKTAESLKAFATIADANLGTTLQDILEGFKSKTNQFVEDVFGDDEANFAG